MARESQYADAYLNENARRGFGNGLTVGTFLSRTLAGKAVAYKGRYETALINACLRRNAIRATSARNRTAFYPPHTPLNG